MSALLFCVAGLFAGASSEQIYKALERPVFDALIIVALVVITARWLWTWVEAWRSAMSWLRSS